MRRLLFVLSIATIAAACGRAKAKGPAWPAASTTGEDGGESIEPRPTSSVAAAIEKSEDAPPKADPETKEDEPEKKEAAPADSGTASPSTSSQPIIDEDVIMSEEIIIEIDE